MTARSDARGASALELLRTLEPVAIIGSGLLGTSLGLSLTSNGVDVALVDASRSNLALAVDYGAGRRLAEGDTPGLVIVCVPPEHAADVVERSLQRWPSARVTDVTSVKLSVLDTLRDRGVDLSRYAGSHPMAGRERGGAISGRADLFIGRPWVVAAHTGVSHSVVAAVDAIATTVGAQPVTMDAAEHDRAVALVSHVPQLVASLLAKQLVDGSAEDLSLAGQGLRDTTRIAASDPTLWMQIIEANAGNIAGILTHIRDDLTTLVEAVGALDSAGSRSTLARMLTAGNVGVGRIPGKHGSTTQFSSLIVMVDDRPGELGRLFDEIGEIGINIEDLRLEHSPGAAIGLAEIWVVPESESRLGTELEQRGWRIAG